MNDNNLISSKFRFYRWVLIFLVFFLTLTLSLSKHYFHFYHLVFQSVNLFLLLSTFLFYIKRTPNKTYDFFKVPIDRYDFRDIVFFFLSLFNINLLPYHPIGTSLQILLFTLSFILVIVTLQNARKIKHHQIALGTLNILLLTAFLIHSIISSFTFHFGRSTKGTYWSKVLHHDDLLGSISLENGRERYHDVSVKYSTENIYNHNYAIVYFIVKELFPYTGIGYRSYDQSTFVNKIYIDDEFTLKFNNCIYYNGCTCRDTNGEEWQISIKK